MYKEPSLQSSYFGTGIGRTLYDYVLKHKPKVIAEFGVLNGYSTVCMAQALKEVGSGTILAYDLWEDAPFGHGQNLKAVEETLEQYGVSEFVELKRGDFLTWFKEHERHSVDLLHVDINNDGDLLPIIYQIECPVLFEGGTETRDECWWMNKFSKPKIFPLKNKYGYEILNDTYPSLSIVNKKKI